MWEGWSGGWSRRGGQGGEKKSHAVVVVVRQTNRERQILDTKGRAKEIEREGGRQRDKRKRDSEREGHKEMHSAAERQMNSQ